MDKPTLETSTDEDLPTVNTDTYVEKPTKKKRARPLKALAILVLIILLGLAIFVVINNFLLKNAADTTPVTVRENTSPAPVTLKLSVLEPGKLVLPNGHADPSVVKTATGYRMYVNRQSGGPTGILVYSSPDGIAWTQEKDIILPGTSTSRAVVLPTGVRIYYPGPQPLKANDPRADMYSTFSTDGLNFTKDPDTVIKPRSNAYYVEGPTVFQLADMSWRMYFNENTVAAATQRDGEIWGASSTDGITWNRDDKVTLKADDVEAMQGTTPAPWKQVLHPFVLTNPRGGYIMFYNSHSEMYAATSNDGLAWEKIGKLGIHGADMDGYFQGDGTIRVYYGDYTPETGGLVYSAVLKVE